MSVIEIVAEFWKALQAVDLVENILATDTSTIDNFEKVSRLHSSESRFFTVCYRITYSGEYCSTSPNHNLRHE